jgi:alpha-amylase
MTLLRAAATAWVLALAACASTPPSRRWPTRPRRGPIRRCPGAFADNPIVYFVITDRFANGNPANDTATAAARSRPRTTSAPSTAATCAA